MLLIKIYLSVSLLSFIYSQNVTEFVLPKVNIHAFRPKGFRLWIPGHPAIQFVYLEANFYNKSNSYQGSVRTFIPKVTSHRWIYENKDLELKYGYIVRYSLFLATNKGTLSIYSPQNINNTLRTYTVKGYGTEFENFRIEYLLDPKKPYNWEIPECPGTVSKTLNKEICGGEVILEENFNSLNEDLWKIEQYIPIYHPEHPFVSYQKLLSNPTVYVKDGLLYIEPKLQQNILGFSNESLFTGTLDLRDGCTRESKECIISTMDNVILPPVVSGRVTSRIPFQYGWIYIRAKLPASDWIYPEIILESFTKKYGTSDYSSGVIKIASTNGNKKLNKPLYGNKVLYAGPILNDKCKTVLERRKELTNSSWSDDFHTYALKWTPDSITFFVDDESWINFEGGARGIRSWIPRKCRGDWYNLLDGAGKVAPFDSLFQLTFSIAVGGSTEFPDDLVTGDGVSKPWRNLERKDSLKFWNDMPNWYPTWTQPKLIVDYVKIVAL